MDNVRDGYLRVTDSIRDDKQSDFQECLQSTVPRLLVDQLMPCAVAAVDSDAKPDPYYYFDAIISQGADEEKRRQLLEHAIKTVEHNASASRVIDRLVHILPDYRWQQNTHSRRTPIQVAAKTKNVDIIQKLFKKGTIEDLRTREMIQNSLSFVHQKDGTALEIAMSKATGRGENSKIVDYLLDKHIEFDVQPRPQFMDLVVQSDNTCLLKSVLSHERSRELLCERHLISMVERKQTNAWDVAIQHCEGVLNSISDAGILHKAIHSRHFRGVRSILKAHPEFACQRDSSSERVFAIKFLTAQDSEAPEVLDQIRKKLISVILRQQSNASEVKLMFRSSDGKSMIQFLIYLLTDRSST